MHLNTNTLSSPRLSSIDFTRGLVIVIMALDHIRDLLHTTSLTQDPLDFETTTVPLFITRWITHFCAPTFVFLAGVSAYLMSKRQNDLAKTRRFLFTRGLWLILLEITIVGFGFWADIKFRTILFQVIFVIGSGFVILSALVKIPAKIIGAIGLLIILLHDAIPKAPFDKNSPGGFIWTLLFESGFYKLTADRALIIGYSIIPWLGVMMFGFGFGKVFEADPVKRKKILLISALLAFVVFIALRFINLYGDPKPRLEMDSGVFTILSFIKVSKYPPSLLYVAMTLSVTFFVLFLADGKQNHVISFFTTYGRVPMFFYILHWYIVHASMFIIIIVQGVSWQQMQFGVMNFGRPREGVGLELPYVYIYWICLVVSMYPLCKWYGKYKATHSEKKWLAYL